MFVMRTVTKRILNIGYGAGDFAAHVLHLGMEILASPCLYPYPGHVFLSKDIGREQTCDSELNSSF